MGSFDVLFVDDEVDFLHTVVKRIQKRNVNALGAKNGEEALALLKQSPVDVVVLDVKMPGMNGIEVLKEIKRKYPLTEVIMLTGHASLEVAIQGMEIGAFDYLMKPVEIDDLLYKLQDANKRRSIQLEKIKGMGKI
jgi:DNA-binding NtrC family response regulator